MSSEDYSYIKPEEISPRGIDLPKTKIIELPPAIIPVNDDLFPQPPPPVTVADFTYIE